MRTIFTSTMVNHAGIPDSWLREASARLWNKGLPFLPLSPRVFLSFHPSSKVQTLFCVVCQQQSLSSLFFHVSNYQGLV